MTMRYLMKFSEVAILEDTENATRECVLLWVHREEAQRVQKSALNEIKEEKLQCH